VNKERWRRIEGVFLAARELDADARPAFLARECAGDRDLRREVETLLAAAEAEPDYLETPPTARPAGPGPERDRRR
jgi:hypothetical protein